MTEKPDKTKLTYADLKAVLDGFSPDQLAQPVVWSGDERGGYVQRVWIAAEDWIGDSSDPETWMARSEWLRQEDPDAVASFELIWPAGTPHLMVD